jgi:hypothetical protein
MKRIFRIFLLIVLILYSPNYLDAQWVRQNSGTNAKLTDVVVLDSMTALVVGYNGTILKTNDAGRNWRLIASNGNIRWNAVAFSNTQNGFVVGDQLTGASTTDGGETWSYWFYSGPVNLLSVTYAGENNVFFTDDSGWIHRSTDGGITWSETCLTSGSPLQSSFFTSTAYTHYEGYAIASGSVFETTNSGESWLLEYGIPQNRSDFLFRGTFNDSNDAIFIVGYEGTINSTPLIYRKSSTDTTWNEISFVWAPIHPSFKLNDISAPGKKIAYTCGTNGIIFKTTNDGNDWSTTIPSSCESISLNAIDFYNESRGFIVGDSGTILFTENGGFANNGSEPSFIPKEFILEQNYPNPFNSTTTIPFSLPIRSFVTLKVFDVIGRKVETLISEELSAGYYRRQWNALGLPSGVYLYRLEANSCFGKNGESVTQTKRLILLR